MEWRAIALAQAAFNDPDVRPASRRFALGPELGQCCGGQVDLVVEVFGRDDRDAITRFADLEAERPFATAGRFGDRPTLDRTVIDDVMPPGSASLSDGILREGFGDERRTLVLFGAGHVGRALVLALAPLPFRVLWFDPRPDAFPAHVPANVDLRRLGEPAEALAAAAEGSFVLVMSHSHQLDLALVEAALAAARFPYVGLIGSRSKRARFEKKLAAGGIPKERIDALVCPIGVEAIHSKVPAVIAAATVAQLIVCDEGLRAATEPDSFASRLVSSRLS